MPFGKHLPFKDLLSCTYFIWNIYIKKTNKKKIVDCSKATHQQKISYVPE